MPIKSRAELLEKFDQALASARAALVATADEVMMQDWSLLGGGKAIFTMSRIACLRMVLNHIIHHRAQLCVYLRMNDVPVPALYGLSAAEGRL